MATKRSASTARPGIREDAQSREERQLDKLEAVFLGEGFRKVTVDKLARSLRCSKRTVYELAPSKEALFLRVFDRYLSRLRDEANNRARGVRPQEAFEPYLMPAVDAARKLSATLIRDMSAYPPANAMWEQHQRERVAGLRRLVDRCVADGVFRSANAHVVAEVVAASLKRIGDPKFLAAAKLSYREAVAEFYGMLIHGLSHSATPRERGGRAAGSSAAPSRSLP